MTEINQEQMNVLLFNLTTLPDIINLINKMNDKEFLKFIIYLFETRKHECWDELRKNITEGMM